MSQQESEPAPKAFISYSWTSDEHSTRVRELADRLIGDGVEVLLDRYDLREGDDRFAYMERSVADPTVTKVLAITDDAYKKKMDGRAGGVGIEGTIMSPKVYQQISGARNKFVAVVFEKDEHGKAHLPTMFESKFYIDMSTDELLNQNYEQLLRFVFDKPLLQKPPLGQKPSYLLDDNRPALVTAGKVSALRDAVSRERTTAARGFFADYLDALEAVLARMPAAVREGLRGDPALARSEVERFMPYRNEYVQLLEFLVRHTDLAAIDLLASLTGFFEHAGGLPERLGQAASYNAAAFGHVSYATHTLFIYTAAVLWKVRRFNELVALLDHAYFIDLGTLGTRHSTYAGFSEHLKLFENTAIGGDGTKQGALMQKHAADGVIAWAEVCQMDALLWIRSVFNDQERWYPRTVAQWEGTAFPAFARAESTRNLPPLARVLGVPESELKPRLEQLIKKARDLLGTHRPWFELAECINLQRLGTRP